MQVSALVPTYRRSKDLARCLEAFKQQTDPADELLIIVRDTDEETHEFLRNFMAGDLSLKVVNVTMPGQVAALNAGLAAATGEIIAITDDDAAPHPDWLEQIQAHFLVDDRIGAVGGRDWVYESGNAEPLSVNKFVTVGKLQWFGRAIGNHHIGSGAAREVDILKGANMSYRKAAILNLRFSDALKGTGAQVCNDMGFSLTVKSKGWKLLYDPKIAVDHFPAQRFDEDQRSAFNPIAQQNMAHNETLVLLKYLPVFRKVIYFAWALLVGTRAVPGVVQVFRFLPSQKELSIQRGFASFQGRITGIRTWFSRSEVQ
jgi:cellulose synthase/poly-beta-1,6-N-acetylglucosamine synthase-like glycosyltransferase